MNAATIRHVTFPTLDDTLNTLNIADTRSLQDLASQVLHQLEGTGYVILRNAPIETHDIPSASDYFLRLSTLIGQPISHDENNSIIWDIKKREQSSSTVQTYSEHSDEAQLHTDSQYRMEPEDFFGLLMLIPASCGGGHSLLMTLSDVHDEIAALPDAQHVMAALNHEQYPFVVPTVFNRNGSQEREFVFAPILQNNSIRFRIDTLEKALDTHRHRLSNHALTAFQALKSIVLHSPRTRQFHLQARDMLFINNRTALHGRTSFTDTNRHLLRIRMKRRENTAI